mmetsp:Transcript_40371/g.96310  ORF Transcript_40371/g.96310 Transcript_40371/m.96310 type:complete len:270 (-) Transcript_40371:109-918(-)
MRSIPAVAAGIPAGIPAAVPVLEELPHRLREELPVPWGPADALRQHRRHAGERVLLTERRQELLKEHDQAVLVQEVALLHRLPGLADHRLDPGPQKKLHPAHVVHRRTHGCVVGGLVPALQRLVDLVPQGLLVQSAGLGGFPHGLVQETGVHQLLVLAVEHGLHLVPGRALTAALEDLPKGVAEGAGQVQVEEPRFVRAGIAEAVHGRLDKLLGCLMPWQSEQLRRDAGALVDVPDHPLAKLGVVPSLLLLGDLLGRLPDLLVQDIVDL